MHYYPSMTWNEILWERSFANLVMLMATIPSYSKDDANEDEEVIESDEDIKNFFTRKTN